MPPSELPLLTRLGRLATRVVGVAVAAALAVAGLVLMSGALLVGAAAAVGLYAWLRLRGGGGGDRVRFGWRTTTMRHRRGSGGAGASGPSGPPDEGEIVDVQVTEVLEDCRPRPRNPSQDEAPRG
jgi:hypothetical protein